MVNMKNKIKHNKNPIIKKVIQTLNEKGKTLEYVCAVCGINFMTFRTAMTRATTSPEIQGKLLDKGVINAQTILEYFKYCTENDICYKKFKKDKK